MVCRTGYPKETREALDLLADLMERVIGLEVIAAEDEVRELRAQRAGV